MNEGARGRGGRSACQLLAVEEIRPGDLLLTHSMGLRRVLAVHRREYPGRLIGIGRRGCDTTLWIGPQQRVAIPLPALPRFRGEIETARRLRADATESEALLWDVLRDRRLGHRFRRQHVLGPFVLDFYCPALRLAVEVDGGIHLTRRPEDASRDAFIHQHEIEVLRIGAAQVEGDPSEAAAGVVAAVAQREREVCYGVRWVAATELAAGHAMVRADTANVATVEQIQCKRVSGPIWQLALERGGCYVTEVCVVRDASPLAFGFM